MMKRLIALGSLALCASLSIAQSRTISVSSPVNRDFLGKTNTVSFNITGARFQVKVQVVATNIATNQTVRSEKDFTPNSLFTITDTLPLNFDGSAPPGAWKVVVTPIEFDGVDPDKLVYSPPQITINPVTVDVKSPTFYTINPLDQTYVKGVGANQIIHINATLNEPNIDKWKVQINAGDIPDNSGSGSTVDVDWSAKGITADGNQTISIKVDDKAKNTTSKSISVILDRISPKSQIVTPGPNTYIAPNTIIPVLVEIEDQFNDSVDATGVDVIVKTIDNKFITRVSRRATNNNGNTLSWSGRIRYSSRIPNNFKIVVTSVDRAGNRATIQETRVRIGNR